VRLFLSREVIISLAVLGGVASLLAMVLQARPNADPIWIGRMNRAAYVLMGISIALFVGRGLLYPQGS
jgi:hypothetical protein